MDPQQRVDKCTGEFVAPLFSVTYAQQLCVTRLVSQPCAKHPGYGYLCEIKPLPPDLHPVSRKLRKKVYSATLGVWREHA
jgi:hypothetical protein